MKSKLSMKVLGIVVTLTTLASLLVGITATPVSAAAPGALTWTATASPSEVGNTLTVGSSINAVAAAADGLTVFAWDNAAKLLYKSTNGGVSWGAGVTVALTQPLVAMKVSPKFATDKTVVLVDDREVFVSNDGGATFASASIDLATQMEFAGGGRITSMDVGYCNGSPTALSIILGIKNGGGVKSNVLMWTAGTYTWAEVGSLTTGGDAGAADPDVLAVMFSPSTLTDAEIMAVYTGGGNTYLASHYGANALAWNAYIPAKNIVASVATNNAAIAVGSDYVGNTASPILVSIYGGATANTKNIYKITARSSGAGTATNLAVAGGAPATDISVPQIVVDGTAAAGTVLWTVVGSPALNARTGGPTSMTAAVISKQPVGGTGQAAVCVGGSTIFASVAGNAGAVSRSTNNGTTFDGVGLIEIGTIGNVTPIAFNVVDANNMYLILDNTTGGLHPARLIFKTADAGATWTLIWTGAGAVEVLSSPAYATDSTIVIITGTNTTPMSTNGGSTFTTPGVPVAATVGLMINGTTFFAGGAAGALYKNTSWAAATGLGTGGAITSIALNPKDATNATVAVGEANGKVYQSTDGGVSFTQVGTGAVPGGTNAMVAYGPDGTIYAGTSTGAWYFGAAWTNITTDPSNKVVISKDNTLYSAALLFSVDRSLNPTSLTPEVCAMNFAGSKYPNTTTPASAADVHVISGAAANSIYMLDTADTQTGYFCKGGIYGFSDTLITAMPITAPKTGAKLTDTISTAYSWPAVAGAKSYYVTTNGVEDNAVGTTKLTYTATVNLGAANTWSVRVCSAGTGAAGTFYGRPSATATFTTALNTIGPAPTALVPAAGAVNVDPTNLTFTWPASADPGITGYNFTLAQANIEGNTPSNHFAIIDYSDTTDTNAITAKETLKYNTTYYWEVQPFNGTSTGAWIINFFTTMPEPVVTTPATTAPPVTTIINNVPTQSPVTPIVTVQGGGTTQQAIPSYLLWAVIAVGAVLVIAVIVLIVRTRRMP